MPLISFITARLAKRRLSTSRLQMLAESLAEQGLRTVIQRSLTRASGMRLSEARGYIRARAALVIHQCVDRELALRPVVLTEQRADLIDLATEAVINLTLRELVSRPAETRRIAKAA